MRKFYINVCTTISKLTIRHEGLMIIKHCQKKKFSIGCVVFHFLTVVNFTKSKKHPTHL